MKEYNIPLIDQILVQYICSVSVNHIAAMNPQIFRKCQPKELMEIQ